MADFESVHALGQMKIERIEMDKGLFGLYWMLRERDFSEKNFPMMF